MFTVAEISIGMSCASILLCIVMFVQGKRMERELDRGWARQKRQREEWLEQGKQRYPHRSKVWNNIKP